jgi:hypothetical protein
MIRMKRHRLQAAEPVQPRKERLEALGLMIEGAVRRGKYKSTVLNWAIVVPSRYCSEWIASARLQACGSHSTWFPRLFHPVASAAREAES